jgi:hypothetical protein
MTWVRCDVGPVVSLGPAKYGERHYVLLLGGSVAGPQFNGKVVTGGLAGPKTKQAPQGACSKDLWLDQPRWRARPASPPSANKPTAIMA